MTLLPQDWFVVVFYAMFWPIRINGCVRRGRQPLLRGRDWFFDVRVEDGFYDGAGRTILRQYLAADADPVRGGRPVGDLDLRDREAVSAESAASRRGRADSREPSGLEAHRRTAGTGVRRSREHEAGGAHRPVDVQTVGGPAVCRESARHRRAVFLSAGSRHRLVDGRKKPSAGPGPHAAALADAPGDPGPPNPRLHPARDDVLVRRLGRRDGESDRAVSSSASPSGVSEISRARRG